MEKSGAEHSTKASEAPGVPRWSSCGAMPGASAPAAEHNDDARRERGDEAAAAAYDEACACLA